ncbi:hypothetical protein M501DRAFT_944581, partial [Patellaria atrata CBS 101060]
SALRPRVAVLLGIDKKWHLPLLLCRGLSTIPPIWWGFQCTGFLVRYRTRGAIIESSTGRFTLKERLVLTEILLAILWCTASAYLSFFFADCLMSRWLLHYTPSATLVRLFTINAVYMYLTSWTLHLSGAAVKPQLLLPAWISIALTLTVLYHLTQRKSNIRRETSAAIRVFWLASFISMCLLLIQIHLRTED